MIQAETSSWNELGVDIDMTNEQIIFQSSILGCFITFGESTYWEEYNGLLDKNMILMIKDTAVGRFMT